MSAPADTRPVAEDLFVDDGADGPALLGTRCRGCGTYAFPQTRFCANPDCADAEPEPVRFGRRGRLYSWTVQGYRPPALFRMDSWQPYAIGLVETEEGLRVLAMLSRDVAAEPSIDMALRLTLAPLYVDAEGRTVLTYQYTTGA